MSELGLTIAKLQRTIARQREHIRALRLRLKQNRELDIHYARVSHQMVSIQEQAQKLIAENIRLRKRNGDLEALHTVVTTPEDVDPRHKMEHCSRCGGIHDGWTTCPADYPSDLENER